MSNQGTPPPQPQTGPVVNESPRRYFKIHDGAAHTQGLAEMRGNLLESSNDHLISCSVDDWFATYAKYSDIKQWTSTEWKALLHHVEKTLKQKKLLNSSGWKSIRDKTSKGHKEDIVFKGIEGIAEAVHSATVSLQPALQNTTVIQCCPRETTASEVPGSSFMSDARAVLVPQREQPQGTTRRSERISNKTPANYKEPDKLISTRSSDTVMPAEFKLFKTPDDCHKNESQLLGGASHLLYNDPCRRFVIGLTIEGDEMRLWHFSRSHIAICSFDYHKHPKHFIHFLIFILFAPTHALGFDPTIKRVVDGEKKVAYQYQVGDEWYQTIGNPLAERSCLPIVARATRVWEVRKILGFDLDGNPQLDTIVQVLKDVWLFEDVKGEKAIQNAIFNNLRKLDEGTPEAGTPLSIVEKARPHFMTILEDVAVEFNGRKDITSGPCQPWKPAQFTYAAPKKAKPATVEGSQRQSCPEGTLHTEENRTTVPLRHTPRIHRRTIFKERCDTIYTLHDFRDLAECLRHNIEGLWYMRLAGYVHRDISGGNCMWHRSEGQGKISDLEYAKPYDEIPLHDPRTGTPEFMAVEFQSDRFLHLPARPAEDRYSEASTTWKSNSIPFTFNFLHDLESVYWMFVWFLFHRMPDTYVKPQPPTPEELQGAQRDDDHPRDKIETQESTLTQQLDNIKKAGRNLFDCDVKGSPARVAIIGRGDPNDILDIVEPLYMECFHLTKGILFLTHLKSAYVSLEASQPVLNSRHIPRWEMDLFTYAPYQRFRQLLQDVLDYIAVSGKSVVVPLPGFQPPPSEPKTGMKRTHDTVHPTGVPVEESEKDRPMKRIRPAPRRVKSDNIKKGTRGI